MLSANDALRVFDMEVHSADLAGQAAQLAAARLTQNWRDAQAHEGGSLAPYLHDVDDVIAQLESWKKLISSRL